MMMMVAATALCPVHVTNDADSNRTKSIPFNLWRASHWYNKPVKKAFRPDWRGEMLVFYRYVIFPITSCVFGATDFDWI